MQKNEIQGEPISDEIETTCPCSVCNSVFPLSKLHIRPELEVEINNFFSAKNVNQELKFPELIDNNIHNEPLFCDECLEKMKASQQPE